MGCRFLFLFSPAFEFLQTQLCDFSTKRRLLLVVLIQPMTGAWWFYFHLSLSLPQDKGSPISESQPNPLCKGEPYIWKLLWNKSLQALSGKMLHSKAWWMGIIKCLLFIVNDAEKHLRKATIQILLSELKWNASRKKFWNAFLLVFKHIHF